MKEVKCSQIPCFALATHRFTWPGSPQQASCYEHALAAQRIAAAMSFELQVLPQCRDCSNIATIFREGAELCLDHARTAGELVRVEVCDDCRAKLPLLAQGVTVELCERCSQLVVGA